MRWQDEAVALSYKNLGENKRILTLFTKEKGLHKGVYRIPAKGIPIQPGSVVHALWSSRAEHSIGTWSIEPIYLPHGSAYFIENTQISLLGLQSAISLCNTFLPEREANIKLYEDLICYIKTLSLHRYCFFEVSLLGAINFSLDLSRCTVTGATEELEYISPRTGRAVSSLGAQGYEEKLLLLPRFLRHQYKNNYDSEPKGIEILKALNIGLYFIKKFITSQNIDIKTPYARQMMQTHMEKIIQTP